MTLLLLLLLLLLVLLYFNPLDSKGNYSAT